MTADSHAHLEIDAAVSLEPETVRATLERYNCALIRNLAPPALIEGILQRMKQVFGLRQAQLDRGELPIPEGYGKSFRHGLVPFLSLQELDMPQGPPFQLIRLFGLSRLMPVIRACVGAPVYCNVAESAARSMTPNRPELYISFHQDGFFDHQPQWNLINCWIPLVPCGIDAPGLDVLPIGLQELLPRSPTESQNHSAYAFENSAHCVYAQRDKLWHPSLRPGDVVMLNPFAVHGTYAHPLMNQVRYNLELRFTGGEIPERLKQTYGLFAMD